MKTLKLLLVAMGLLVSTMSLRLQTHARGSGDSTPEQESLSTSQTVINNDPNFEDLSF